MAGRSGHQNALYHIIPEIRTDSGIILCSKINALRCCAFDARRIASMPSLQKRNKRSTFALSMRPAPSHRVSDWNNPIPMEKQGLPPSCCTVTRGLSAIRTNVTKRTERRRRRLDRNRHKANRNPRLLKPLQYEEMLRRYFLCIRSMRQYALDICLPSNLCLSLSAYVVCPVEMVLFTFTARPIWSSMVRRRWALAISCRSIPPTLISWRPLFTSVSGADSRI